MFVLGHLQRMTLLQIANDRRADSPARMANGVAPPDPQRYVKE